MADSTKQTVIENGTEFDGSIRSECAITLSGKLKGQVDAPALTVTSTGNVQGNVKVSQFRSEGEVAGEVEAEVVELSGRVSDDTVIRAKELEVRLSEPNGALKVAFGNCELQVGERRAQRSGEPAKGSAKTDKPEKKKEAPADSIVDAVSDLMT